MLDRSLEDIQQLNQFLPFEMGYLPKEFQDKAVVEINETDENKMRGLTELREMVQLENNLTGIHIDDEFLMVFLRYAKYDITEAFSRLKNLMKLKRDNENLFSGQLYDVIVKTATDKIMIYLPYRCPDGCGILYINLDNWIPEEFSDIEVKRMAPIILLQGIREPMNQVNGFKVIIDAKSNPFRHLRYCSFQNLYLIYFGTQCCFPGRFHSYHVVNMSFTAKFCLQMMKHVLPEELKRKIHIHSSKEELLEHFPSEVIPQEYGGQLENFDMTGWLKRVMEPEKLEKMCGTFQD
ncbi:alpha-tocopherol transfer protein-like [Nephila pilipes]|uniref:Alpha-tocopherol transfer protein-like n=1 Tax=Nephila pilipes TaxID=299642 RepID=A0A8X6MQL0_NEPPI|nr:alpha-tocopherol transfer protein-like [Nephila pilipes]